MPNFCTHLCHENLNFYLIAMKEERDEAVYATFKRVWASCPHLSYDEAIDKAINTEQPRLWASFHGVYRVLRKILYNHGNGLIGKYKPGLEEEVRVKYNRLKRQPIFREASPYFLAAFIVSQPSKGFYISHATAKRIIWKIRKLHRASRK